VKQSLNPLLQIEERVELFRINDTLLI